MTTPTGRVIVLEGLDGTGKTTIATALEQSLMHDGRSVVRLREPGGTMIGEQIRSLLLDPTYHDASRPLAQRLDLDTEIVLFFAARQALIGVMIEYVNAGSIVILDRFWHSTVAYQGAKGASVPKIMALVQAIVPAQHLLPLTAFALQAPADVRRARMAQRGIAHDRFESEPQAIQEARERLYAQMITGSYLKPVDANRPVDAVVASIRSACGL